MYSPIELFKSLLGILTFGCLAVNSGVNQMSLPCRPSYRGDTNGIGSFLFTVTIELYDCIHQL
jgi:hypothetical protein